MTEIYEYDISKDLECGLLKLPGFGTKYIIAGGFIHDVIHNLIYNDIDFFIMKKEGFYELLKFFNTNYNIIKYNIFPSLIEILYIKKEFYEEDTNKEEKKIYKIQLINSLNKSPSEIINMFDMEYIRTYFDGKNIYVTTSCLDSWNTKVLKDLVPYHHIRKKRILKAITKGYKFERRFLVCLGIDLHTTYIIEKMAYNGKKYQDKCCNAEGHRECIFHDEKYWNEGFDLDLNLVKYYNFRKQIDNPKPLITILNDNDGGWKTLDLIITKIIIEILPNIVDEFQYGNYEDYYTLDLSKIEKIIKDNSKDLDWSLEINWKKDVEVNIEKESDVLPVSLDEEKEDEDEDDRNFFKGFFNVKKEDIKRDSSKTEEDDVLPISFKIYKGVPLDEEKEDETDRNFFKDLNVKEEDIKRDSSKTEEEMFKIYISKNAEDKDIKGYFSKKEEEISKICISKDEDEDIKGNSNKSEEEIYILDISKNNSDIFKDVSSDVSKNNSDVFKDVSSDDENVVCKKIKMPKLYPYGIGGKTIYHNEEESEEDI